MCLAGHTDTKHDEMRTQTICSIADIMWTQCLFLLHVLFIHFLSLTFSAHICINSIPGSHPKVRSSPNRISGDSSLQLPLCLPFHFLPFSYNSDTCSVKCLKNPTHFSSAALKIEKLQEGPQKYTESCDMSRWPSARQHKGLGAVSQLHLSPFTSN